MRKKFLPRVLWSVAFSLSSAGQYLVFGSSDLSIETIELFRIYVLYCFWSDVVVRIYPQFWCCGESIPKNAFRRFEPVYRPEMHLQNSEKLQSWKDLVKYSASAECEIIHFVNCEILLLRRNVKWNLPTFASANISHLQSKYFTAKLFHLPEGQISLKKALASTSAFFWQGRQICHYQLLEFVLSRFRCELFFVKV